MDVPLGILSTRPRDYYDAYMLLSTVRYDKMQLSRALRSTAQHRGTEEIVENWSSGLTMIADSKAMRERWENYCREFSYAKGITFDNVCKKVRCVLTEANFRR